MDYPPFPKTCSLQSQNNGFKEPHHHCHHHHWCTPPIHDWICQHDHHSPEQQGPDPPTCTCILKAQHKASCHSEHAVICLRAQMLLEILEKSGQVGVFTSGNRQVLIMKRHHVKSHMKQYSPGFQVQKRYWALLRLLHAHPHPVSFPIELHSNALFLHTFKIIPGRKDTIAPTINNS